MSNPVQTQPTTLSIMELVRAAATFYDENRMSNFDSTMTIIEMSIDSLHEQIQKLKGEANVHKVL